ncbi:MAG: hypothetical protein ACJAX6_000184 [Limisphaerales bacterium]|jgi:hypothetical protein|tara:strand:- start:131 stop:334 length:204 start_codon:yes stop_codon:yes gene_type:complete
MFWGVLIGVMAVGVFGASTMTDSIVLVDMYKEMSIGVGVGVGTASVIFAIGAAVVSAIDYSRKRNAS